MELGAILKTSVSSYIGDLTFIFYDNEVMHNTTAIIEIFSIALLSYVPQSFEELRVTISLDLVRVIDLAWICPDATVSVNRNFMQLGVETEIISMTDGRTHGLSVEKPTTLRDWQPAQIRG